jgi:hypothetical protein
MVSFDLVSPFTRIPTVQSLKNLSHHLSEETLAVFRHVLTSTYFSFRGKFCEQTVDVAMGSPLSPAAAIFEPRRWDR